MHRKKIHCRVGSYRYIQNKALNEAQLFYMLNCISANKYTALFGYKCTINTKIFTCFPIIIIIIIWMIVN